MSDVASTPVDPQARPGGFWRSRRSRRALASIVRRAARFRRDEDGSFVVFSLFLFITMLMVGGLAVDLMRYENYRTHMQNTLDRAILAAADLDQELVPQDVVEDYFAKAGLEDFLVSVEVSEGLNFRTVSASAEVEVPSMFMRLVGITSIDAPANGAAEESVTNVEISLILDISGSMGWNNKMENLQDAAKDFVDAVLVDESEDLISMSIIPYTAQVNAGPDLFNQVNVNQVHGYSHCIDFDEEDFDATGLEVGKTYTQMQHFEWSSYYYSDRSIDNPGCPQQTFERITVHSQDNDDLKDQIDDFRARANTAIHLGMKWGTLLLDPQSQPIVANLSTSGVVDAAFADRPDEWSSPDTAKFVVLMTDGQNVDTFRIADWAYNSNSEYIHWSRYTLWWYLYNYVSYYNRSYYYYEKYSSTDADQMLDNICTAAKNAGIIVYTVGFEVTNYSAGVMEDCASAPSYFFRVEGVEISSAFAAIARDINQLKLIQ